MRYHREKQKRSKEEDVSQNDREKYVILSNAIKDPCAKVKSRKEKYSIQKIFEEKAVTSARKKTQIIQECLTVKQGYIRANQKIGKKVLGSKIKGFFGRNDVSRATAGKKETVTFKKHKMQKRYLLDSMKNLYNSFEVESPP
nr:unnamed protein product [Callosobruchus analis]